MKKPIFPLLALLFLGACGRSSQDLSLQTIPRQETPSEQTSAPPAPTFETITNLDWSLNQTEGKLHSPSIDNNSSFGQAVAVGDWDNDGIQDLAVGAPNGDYLSTNSGRVFIYWGKHNSSTIASTYLESAYGLSSSFGFSLLSTDLNADGIDDLIVGAPNEDRVGTDTGSVYIYRGGAGFLSGPYQVLDQPEFRIRSGFGSALAVQDLNGDTFPELIIGSYLDDEVATDAGAFWVFQGESNSLYQAATADKYSYSSASNGYNLGISLGVTLYDNDAFHDILVGAPNSDSPAINTGSILIFAGTGSRSNWVVSPSTSQYFIENPTGLANQNFGYSFAFLDYDQNEQLDLLVGLPFADYGGTNRGAMMILEDFKASDDLDDLILPPNNLVTDQQFGYPIIHADLSGDGIKDLLIGSPLADDQVYNQGKVAVFHGSESAAFRFNQEDQSYYLHSLAKPAYLGSDDFYGSALCHGDFNDDGREDLVVGAYSDDTKAFNDGAVFIYLAQADGSFSNKPSLPALTSPGSNPTVRSFGSACVVFDYNRDGLDDLIIGAEGDDSAATNAGALYFYQQTANGLQLTSSQQWANPEVAVNSGFGFSLAQGDLNNDGFPDLVVGSPSDDTGGINRGVVYVFESDSAGWISQSRYTIFEGADSNNEQFGFSVGVYDEDGNGQNDLLVGSPYYDLPGKLDAGRVVVFHNTAAANTLLDDTNVRDLLAPTPVAGTNYGSALAEGFYTNNSYPDLFVGSFANSVVGSRAGVIYWYPGTINGHLSTPDHLFNPDITPDSDYFGKSIAVFDFNQNGTTDLFVGSYFDGETGYRAGAVHFFLD